MDEINSLVSAGITAAPRSVSYLRQTLDSLLPQLPAVRLFVEPGTELPSEGSGCRLIQNPVRLGNCHNWLAMCRYLLDNTDTPYLLTVEDDALFAADAVESAVTFARTLPEFGFVSLYTCSRYKEMAVRQGRPSLGFRQLPVTRLWGACAWLFQRASLEAVIRHPRIDTWKGSHPALVKGDTANIDGVDVLVGQILVSLNLPMFFATPSLVEHLGAASAVGNTRGLTPGRRAMDFVGINNGDEHVGTD